MNVKPILDRIIVDQDPAENNLGIFELADTAKQAPRQGTVMAVGPGAIYNGVRIPMEAKVGDRVEYAEFSGSNVTIDGKPYVVIKEGELLFIL